MSSEPTPIGRRRRFFTLTGFGSGVVVVALVVLITRCGQPPPGLEAPAPDETGYPTRTAGQDEELRLRVLSDEGIFIVYDAALPAEAARTTPGYLAYWLDSATGRPFIYDRLIMTRGDIGAALLDLGQDLVIDIDVLADDEPVLAAALNDALAAPEPGEGSFAGIAGPSGPGEPPATAPRDAGPHWHDATSEFAFEIMGPTRAIPTSLHPS